MALLVGLKTGILITNRETSIVLSWRLPILPSLYLPVRIVFIIFATPPNSMAVKFTAVKFARLMKFFILDKQVETISLYFEHGDASDT